MAEIKVGDRVRVKQRTDWPSSPGYRLTQAEGTVVAVVEPDDDEGFQGFVGVKLDKTPLRDELYAVLKREVDTDFGAALIFREEALERL